MGRSFPFRFQGRSLSICVVPVEEAWELWVAEDEQFLSLGGKVSADEAVEAWRLGEDRIVSRAEEVKSHVLTGKMCLGPQVRASKPRNERLHEPEAADVPGLTRRA
jgi:hypothetical protein